jgi:hypothetical protein
MRRFAVALILAAVIPPYGGVDAQQPVDDAVVRQAIESVLELDTYRGANRLPRVSFEHATGDLTVVFAMRRPFADDAQHIVASATNDIFNIFWASYSSSSAPSIRTITVLGTYAVVGRYERPREIPLMRAVMSAERAARLDWTRVATVDPGSVLDVWWVYGELVGSQLLQ